MGEKSPTARKMYVLPDESEMTKAEMYFKNSLFERRPLHVG